MTLLDFYAEEAVGARGGGVASCASCSALVEACFEDEQCFFEIGADDLLEASDDFAVGGVFCAFEEEWAALFLR